MLFRKPNRRKAQQNQDHIPAVESIEDRMLLSAVNATASDVDDSSDVEAITAEAESDAVLDWNNLFNDILVANEELQNPGYASRSMAILNVSIYDAVTLVNGEAENSFYDYDEDLTDLADSADAELAASQAAYTVLSSLYTDQQDMIDSFMSDVLADEPVDSTTVASLHLGTLIGETILEARADDGSDAIVDYEYSEGIGVFQADPLNPDVPVWGPGWSEVDTFSISSAEDFVPESPPDITSEEYAASYNEVLELGSVDSETRTAEQTEIGIFWAYDETGLGTPMHLFNDVLEAVSISQGNTLEENAALYASASVALADAGVVAWETKFSEEFWRPVTAIQEGDNDGNPLTEGDADWTALGAPDGEGDIIGFTPQFPTYVSGHATFGGALFGAIREFYGTDDISFELTSKELELLLEDPELMEAYGLDLDDATREYTDLTTPMLENGRSRVYLGIHFDFDDLVGQEVGQAVAEAVSSQFVVPSSGSGDTGITADIDLANLSADDVTVSEQDGSLVVVNDRTGEVLSTESLDELQSLTVTGSDNQSERITLDRLTSTALPDGVTVIGGSNRNDVLVITPADDSASVSVTNDGVTLGDMTVSVSGIDRIVIDASNGIGAVSIADDLDFEVTLTTQNRDFDDTDSRHQTRQNKLFKTRSANQRRTVNQQQHRNDADSFSRNSRSNTAERNLDQLFSRKDDELLQGTRRTRRR